MRPRPSVIQNRWSEKWEERTVSSTEGRGYDRAGVAMGQAGAGWEGWDRAELVEQGRGKLERG